MKKILYHFLFFCLLFILLQDILLAQKRTPSTDEKVYTKVAEVICSCIESSKTKVDFQKFESRKSLDSCMSAASLKYRTELGIPDEIPNIITPELAVNLTNIYASPAITFLIKNCNYFAKNLYESMWYESSERGEIFKKEQERQKEEIKTEIKVDSLTYQEEPAEAVYEEDPIPRLLVKGKIEKLETKNYTFLVIKNLEGKEEKFVWLRNFGYDIAEDLARNFKKYKGKNVVVEYGETEIFDVKTNKFVIQKEIYALEWE